MKEGGRLREERRRWEVECWLRTAKRGGGRRVEMKENAGRDGGGVLVMLVVNAWVY